MGAADAAVRRELRPRLVRLRVPLMLGGVATVLAIAAVAWLSGGRYQTTEDAYVHVASVEISANIAGRVVEVAVKENQRVAAGQVLFRLDPIPYEIATEQAAAQLSDARQQEEVDVAALRERRAALDDARHDAAFREQERRREQGLLAAGAVSQAQYDQAARAADEARLKIAAAEAQLTAAQARLGASVAAGPSHASVRAARAQVARARLQQDWTVIRAPQAGRVTKVDRLQVGDYVEAATPVFHLVTDRVWIEAAFKENQLKDMRVGQAAEIKVDAYPGRTFEAVVESLAPGTDQTFSLLPAQNATGNWIKVVQRLPVRLRFIKAPPITLQGGLSAHAKVDTGRRRGIVPGAGAG